MKGKTSTCCSASNTFCMIDALPDDILIHVGRILHDMVVKENLYRIPSSWWVRRCPWDNDEDRAQWEIQKRAMLYTTKSGLAQHESEQTHELQARIAMGEYSGHAVGKWRCEICFTGSWYPPPPEAEEKKICVSCIAHKKEQENYEEKRCEYYFNTPVIDLY